MPPPTFLSLSRRSLLLAALAAAAPASWALPARALQFPRDFGSHPELQTEWWYITGHAKTPAGREFGVDALEDLDLAVALLEDAAHVAHLQDRAGVGLLHGGYS